MLIGFLSLLKIKTEISFNDDYFFKGKNNSLIIDMCKKLNGNVYIFGELGANYVNNEEFRKNDVKIYFQKYIHPEYFQPNGNFENNMSIVDLLFNCVEDSSEIIFENNVSKKDLIKKFN